MSPEGRTGWAELPRRRSGARSGRWWWRTATVSAADLVLVERVLHTPQDISATLWAVEDEAPLVPSAEAKVVLRIFAEYAAGVDVSEIGRGLPGTRLQIPADGAPRTDLMAPAIPI